MTPVTRHIFLVGFMASGKSTIGPALADHLQVPFLDLDQAIAQDKNCSIGELIQQHGEPYFRQLETEYLQKFAATPATVIALGGGAFVAAENRKIIAAHGISVWLDTAFAICWQRIQQENVLRPLALTEAAAQQRFLARQTIYQLADIRISIGEDASPLSIVNKIIQKIYPPDK